jgi:hypothetical protein
MADRHLEELLSLQEGVISRRQAHALGLKPHDIARRLRRRDWVRLLPGVFLNHTGEPTWLQRAWAGVLLYWPAALSHTSALRAYAGPGSRRHEGTDPIHVCVATGRNMTPVPGYQVHRVTGLDEHVRWNLAPPRVSIEHAAVTVAADAASEFDAIAVLADACQSRRTTARRLLVHAESRSRLRRRSFLVEVLSDIAAGACSVLEHGYLHRVERRHGLPTPRRQAGGTSRRGPLWRDVDYPEYGLVVELDGRLFHDTVGARDRDLDRDLDAAVDVGDTVRIGWGQVFDRGCWTAGRIGVLLQRRGWSGSPRKCGPDCMT